MKRITEKQIELLKECYLKVTLAECQMITGLSLPTIRKYARRLNLGISPLHSNQTAWTKEQDAFLINYKDRMSHQEIAEMLGRSKNAVALRYHYLLAKEPQENEGHSLLNMVQMEWLKKNYPYRLNSYLAKILEITEDDVVFWADRLELKKWEKKQ